LNFQGVDRKKNPIINGQPLKLATYDKIGEEYEHNPSGNLMSSTKELSKWLNEILKINKGTHSTEIISKSSLEKMWSENYLANDANIYIGLGWWIKEDDKLGKSYFHVGTNTGYCSIVMIYPEIDFGIVILSNGWYGKEVIWKKLFYKIVELYHGE
jgi:CubicO group peptidase (beta-lactamase class C family)